MIRVDFLKTDLHFVGRQLRFVMKDGELFDPATLDRLLPTPRAGPAKWWRDFDPSLRPGAVSAGGVEGWYQH